MAKAVLTIFPSSIYDDLPEAHYHFPRTFLRQMEAAAGGWVIYYQPRSDSGISRSDGQQVHFAVARVGRVRPELAKHDHFYPETTQYLTFDQSVSLKGVNQYREPLLRRQNAAFNKSAYSRTVAVLLEAKLQPIHAPSGSRFW
ncbi:hypothetical protein J2T60_001619 [Natronospira proteinivora]|uniref:Uncharacterized protein n=1 Tax=Natronospira proteinivora TaxID=1807133 RepID=A0ABT1G8H5_9GAMM|nr:hypothetical protein [Natronospira proteinivora]MCP1727619.1 hypothetical protein [Natronospira proteinivora]